ncbi:hypothetical protein ACH5RR_028595 [Cinchona calisaya]|uniref:Uncharacterized protein n=1 Tax=Cinchona calisaya TaxID=153742 RepID=A0ABD2YR38_9GENT
MYAYVLKRQDMQQLTTSSETHNNRTLNFGLIYDNHLLSNDLIAIKESAMGSEVRSSCSTSMMSDANESDIQMPKAMSFVASTSKASISE